MYEKKCVLATDSITVRDSFASSLQNLTFYFCCDYDAILDTLQTNNIEILVVDRLILGINIERAMMGFFKSQPAVKVVCFCKNDCDKNLGLRLFRAGVKAVITSDMENSTIDECFSRVLDERTFFPAHIKEAIHNNEHIINADRNGRITKREQEILENMVAGVPMKETGRTMNISIGTVSSMRTRIKQKLGVNTTSEVIALAYQAGLVR